MHNILDRVAARRCAQFRPQSESEFFALHLARKLGDEIAVRHYAQLAASYPHEHLLAAYRHALGENSKGENLGTAFHVALEHIRGTGQSPPARRLLAIKVDRRSVSIALFVGARLDYTEIRHLSTSRQKAEASTAAFINSMLSQCSPDSAAVEQPAHDVETQRVALSALVTNVLRENAIPVWEPSKQDVLAAYAHRSTPCRREVRDSVRAIWPVLEGANGVLDATGLGLYVQTERLFQSD